MACPLIQANRLKLRSRDETYGICLQMATRSVASGDRVLPGGMTMPGVRSHRECAMPLRRRQISIASGTRSVPTAWPRLGPICINLRRLAGRIGSFVMAGPCPAKTARLKPRPGKHILCRPLMLTPMPAYPATCRGRSGIWWPGQSPGRAETSVGKPRKNRLRDQRTAERRVPRPIFLASSERSSA